jgi:hypothetical protein
MASMQACRLIDAIGGIATCRCQDRATIMPCDYMLCTADIYKAMARARSREAAVHVTVPGVIEPGPELVAKNESDHSIRVVADPQETLTLKTRDRPQ